MSVCSFCIEDGCVVVFAQAFHATTFVAYDDVEMVRRRQVVVSVCTVGMKRMDLRLLFDIAQVIRFHVALKIGTDNVLGTFHTANICPFCLSVGYNLNQLWIRGCHDAPVTRQKSE